MRKTVVLGICGGIAAYKAADIVSRLRKLDVEVYCILTAHGAEFITPLTLSSLSNHPVVCDMFDAPVLWEVEHIALAQRADVFLIAPATANILGKMANGIADDMLSTTVMATRAPVIVAPAMNTAMYTHPATQENLNKLRGRGIEEIVPESGRLACGDVGIGKLADPATIVERVMARLTPRNDLLGKRVMVTAGPTREALDPVRYISNHSSGKMGYAIAEAAKMRGAEVVLVSGPTVLRVPDGVELVPILSTEQMYDAVLARFDAVDMVIKAAAPADFRAEVVSEGKIKKQGDGGLVLRLVQTPDILRALGEKKRDGQVLVAFAAETGDLEKNAVAKLTRKNADMIVANDVTQSGAGFDVDTNVASMFFQDGRKVQCPLMSKRELADKIIDEVLPLLRK